MGQKVCPIGLRLGITETWRSKWYATQKDFGRYLVEDARIRQFVKKNYGFAGIPKVEIERTKDTNKGEMVTVTIHSASPGLLIGRRGAKVESLKSELETLTKKPVDLKVKEIETPELDSTLVAQAVAQQLEKRAPYRRALRRSAETVMQLGGRGVRIRVAGRIGGAEIARSELVILGSVPLHTLRAKIDYGTATAVLSKGTIGVKVWIFKGEQLPKEKAPRAGTVHAAHAQADQVPQVDAGHHPG